MVCANIAQGIWMAHVNFIKTTPQHIRVVGLHGGDGATPVISSLRYHLY